MPSTPNIVSKGLYQDADYMSQPEGTYPYALNAVNVSLLGHQGYLSSERGNTLAASLPSGYYPIGSVNMLNNEVLIFSVLPTEAGSEIGIFNSNDNSYTTIINDTQCFNFNINHQIQGVFKLRKGCNRTVYWTDYYNPIRVIDVDDVINNPTKYQNAGNWDCDSFTLNLPRTIPTIDRLDVIDSGGSLRVGTYQVVLRYLDSDFNPTPWFDLSNPIPIVDESLTTPYDQIDGFPAVVTNVTTMNTTKSIKATVTNIDEDFRYIQMAVFEYTSAVPNTPRVVVKPYISVTSSTMVLTYAGFNSNGDEIIETDEITVPPVTWDMCKTINHLDNQLILGNIKSKEVDFASFQSSANSIQVNYITKALYQHDGPKSYRYYDKYRSLMRDEVYSLGVVYVFNDGTETPAFHIPGRAKDVTSSGASMPSTDTDVANGWHSRDDFNNGWDSSIRPTYALSFSSKDTPIAIQTRGTAFPERWMVYNTAHRTEDVDITRDYLAKGELAYWESDLAYPSDTDCNGDPIYPTNADGTPAKIRHHKMPDTTLEPHFYGYTSDITQNPFGDSTARIITLGLSFANIQIPAAYVGQIQGYKIVIGDRDNNRSVIDKGIFYKNVRIAEYLENTIPDINIISPYYQQGFPYNRQRALNEAVIIPNIIDGQYPMITLSDDKINEPSVPVDAWDFYDYTNYEKLDTGSFSFHSPLLKFKRPVVNAVQAKIERELSGTAICYSRLSGSLRDQWETLCSYEKSFVPVVTATDRTTNRVLSGKAYVDPHSSLPASTTELNTPFLNATGQETFVVEFDQLLLGCEFAGSNGRPLDTTNEATGSDTISNCYYGSLKTYNTQLYGNIDTIKYIQGSRCLHSSTLTTVDIFPGDTFITRFNFRKTFESMPIREGVGSDRNILRDGHMPEYWVESDINSELRNEGDTSIFPASDTEAGEPIAERYYRKSYYNALSPTLAEFLGSRFYNINYYAYNDNYSQRNIAKYYFPLIQGFNYCSNCLEKYPNRLAYSVKSSQEDRFDNYRLFPANNYKDIPQGSGEITNLFTKRNDLYIQTTQSLWVQKLGQLELQSTSAENVQVGTGTEFSLPTTELINTVTGYSGCQSQWATISTEAGTFYVNQDGGKVFLFSDTLKEISQMGLRNYFKNNLKSKFAQQFYQLLGYLPSSIDNPANPYIGVGCLSAYDEANKRFILTKKDYSFTDAFNAAFVGEFDSTASYQAGDIVFMPVFDRFQLYTSSSGGGLLEFSDTDYFKNESFTISYSLLTEAWTSFHSYLPLFYFLTRDKFFSSNSNILLEHNTGLTGVFRESYEPFIVELVAKANPLQTQIWENFMFVQDSVSASTALVDYIDNQDVTFNKAIFYNSRQSTGELSLVNKPANDPFRSLTYSPTTALVERLERNWKINNFRDNVVQTNPEQGLFTASWTNATYQSQYPIDKVANTNVISSTKSQFELARLRDKFMVIRLINDDTANRAQDITIKFTDTKFETSRR